MRSFFITIILSVLYFVTVNSQSSTNGYIFTPSGNLHVMFIFVGFTDINDATYGEGYNTWHKDSIPRWAKGVSNKFFNKNINDIGNYTQNLSNYIKVNSNSNFTITGESYPHLIKTTSTSNLATAIKNHIEANQSSLNWSDFDKRTNKSTYSVNNNSLSPDYKFDYVCILRRDLSESGGSVGKLV